TIVVNSQTYSTDTVVGCVSYTWIDGKTYTSDTTGALYTYVGGNANGCDSTVTLHLKFDTIVTGTEVQVACGSYYWSLKDSTYMVSTNTDTVILTSVNGCDSVVTLYLTINNSVSSIDTVVSCDSYYWSLKDSTYIVSMNSDTVILTSVNGCDSVVALHLTINNSVASTDTVVSCDSYYWSLKDSTYTESTTADTIILSAENGCDSIVALYLTIHQPSILTLQNGAQDQTVCAGDTIATTRY